MINKALIDLHLHLDGSLSVASARKLAKMQNIELPADDGELLNKLQVDDTCKNLSDYLKRFDYPLTLLQTEEAIEESVFLLLEELRANEYAYAEIRFAPQLHLKKGLNQRQVIEAALKGKYRSGFPCGLILCCMRNAETHEVNLETVRLAAEYLEDGVCAVDLAGGGESSLFKTFAKEFELAKELKIPITIHAGEADGPESVWLALSFGATRIGHGVRSVEDSELLKELARRGTVLELCPTSNLDTHVFERLEDYPIRQLMDAGVKVTINSDNMTVSGTDVAREMSLIQETFALTDEEIVQLKINSIEAAFCKEAFIKTELED